MSELKKYLVVRDSEGKFEIWTKQQYEKYINGCVEFGAGSAFGIVHSFDGDEDYLFPKSPDPSILKTALEKIAAEPTCSEPDPTESDVEQKHDEMIGIARTALSAYSSSNGVKEGEWVSVDSMKRLIADMKKKNFREEIIVEEVEKWLDDPQTLMKVIPPKK